jgi:hypothetical protein
MRSKRAFTPAKSAVESLQVPNSLTGQSVCFRGKNKKKSRGDEPLDFGHVFREEGIRLIDAVGSNASKEDTLANELLDDEASHLTQVHA